MRLSARALAESGETVNRCVAAGPRTRDLDSRADGLHGGIVGKYQLSRRLIPGNRLRQRSLPSGKLVSGKIAQVMCR